ncbi:PorT family protein [Marivirga sp. S37H4]|uniref:PorT family protein n=1 Tax=Marivirga aurantiaca TaxID=2802615 RepID=A0A935C7X8_9BACT|nr:porin family protein [Marivirga aurantiaca]MBK6265286.1 PorT family protein [Marivirga aurantiaca]
MRRTILFFAVLCVFSLKATAQESQSGIRGALNLSNLYVDDVDDENMKPGFAVGFYFRKNIADVVSIQPEINYSLKGSQINYNSFLGNGKYRFNLSYIEIPVLANFHVGESLYFSAGPYVAALIAAKVKDVDGDGTVNSVRELDRDDFNTFDYGVAAGVGFDFSGGTAGVRYNYGLNEVAPNNDGLENGKNSVLQFFVGFAF